MEKQCWLCHRKQDELLMFAEDRTKCSEYLADFILDYENEKDVFLEIDVLGTKVTVCPVCYNLMLCVLDSEYFEDRFDDVLSKYRVKGQLELELEEGADK